MSSVRRPLVDAVRHVLAGASDPERAAGQQRYMKSAMPFRGVRLPQVRSLVGEVLADPAYRIPSRAQWEAAVRTLWDEAAYREEWYAATILIGHRLYRDWQDAATLALHADLIVSGAWWDVVDELAAHHVGEILRTHRSTATPVIRGWATVDDMWLRRAAIISQLLHRADTDLALLAEAIEANLETDASGVPTAYGREFFIRKAIGWALRQHARTDPQWVRDFVAGHEERISGLSKREALKHL